MYKVTEINNVKTYNMSAGKSYSQFMEDAKKNSKALRYDDEYKKRIELIQDFQFQIATNQVEISQDQRYIITSGIYGPQVKIYDTSELALKCLRGVDSEVIKFKILSEDYKKVAMIQNDRSVDFHAQYGAHYKTRIPHCPRDLQYNPFCANLCVSASAPQIYRISLEEGKFLVPFHTDSNINSMHFNDKLNVLACGGDQLEIWDFRERKRVCKVQASSTITQVKFDPSGLLIGVGQGSNLNIMDVRYDRKLFSIKSAYNEPINSIHFMDNNEKNILFSNKKQIKITDGNGKFFTSVEPDHAINMFSVVKNSGLLMAALDDPKVGCFFIPQLGPGPKWIPYVDNITEELEEDHTKMIYDEYKFVSKQEVEDLGCENLINTRMLKEHMHGFLMHEKLYNKLKDKIESANITDMLKNKVDKQVNRDMPKQIESKESAGDARFSVSHPDYEVNRLSDDYLQRHSHLKKSIEKEREQKSRNLQREMHIKKKNKNKQIRK